MKKNNILVVVFAVSISFAAVAAEEPQTIPVQRFVESGSLVQRAPRVTVLANDPYVLQHIENVQRQARTAMPLSASSQQPAQPQVEVIHLESSAISSVVVNNTNTFIFQDITPADTTSQQGVTRVSAAERMQQVELLRRSIANEKRAAQ